MPREIIVLDIETTGLNPKEDLILELGMVKLSLETGEITVLFDQVFTPVARAFVPRDSSMGGPGCFLGVLQTEAPKKAVRAPQCGHEGFQNGCQMITRAFLRSS